jgi:hypothetical protein
MAGFTHVTQETSTKITIRNPWRNRRYNGGFAIDLFDLGAYAAMPLSPVARDASTDPCDVGSHRAAQRTAMIPKTLFLANDPYRIGTRIIHDHGLGHGLPSMRTGRRPCGDQRNLKWH